MAEVVERPMTEVGGNMKYQKDGKNGMTGRSSEQG